MKAKAVKWVPAAIVLLAALVLLCLNATRSGLWYDEGVEYFYSSVVSGPVPGWSETQNMYERITETFQPPLYNVLMHLWLLAFDSEFGFRLAGILTTLAGGIGLFLAFRKMTDPLWAAAGTATYLFTGQVMEYALECAEYNLVLCFLCWTLFFFVKAFLEKGTGSLAGFFLCACLSVYSQYGAAFAVVPLYLALMIRMWKDGTKRKQMLLFSGGAVLLAIPLVIFFLIGGPSARRSNYLIRMRMLGVTENKAFLLNILVNILVYVIAWAVQMLLVLHLAKKCMSLPEYSFGPQGFFSLLVQAFGGQALLPTDRFFFWVTCFAEMLSLAIGAACFRYARMYRRFPAAAVIIVVLTIGTQFYLLSGSYALALSLFAMLVAFIGCFAQHERAGRKDEKEETAHEN